MLIRSGFMDEFGKEWLFPSIEDAATFAARGKRVVSDMIVVVWSNTVLQC